jgi:hypothetical protein
MPKTALSFFGMDADSLIAKYPDFESQLFYVVVPYLGKYKPFPTAQSLYMAVFFPAARNVAPSTRFEDLYKKIYPADYEKMYIIFKEQNKGITVVQDYINKVEKAGQKSFFLLAAIVGVAVAAVTVKGIL